LLEQREIGFGNTDDRGQILEFHFAPGEHDVQFDDVGHHVAATMRVQILL